MVFSSVLFVFAFLPVFLGAYYVVPARFRNAMALLGSLLFYAWGAPAFVFVLLASTAIDYWISHRLVAERNRKLVSLSLVVNVSVLLYFKYANFFVDEFNALLEAMGGSGVSWAPVALPIGISFFTFQKISYVIDVYRGGVQPARSYADCLLYVVLFPQLIAGPIVRYQDIDQQIRNRSHRLDNFVHGCQRFTIGLAKKVLIANSMAALADPVYATPVGALPAAYAWLGVAAYYFQIYFDFSGYSDMAIGLGRMMGFEFRENFERPYIATTFTDFWRRWHISLSLWMREYLYISLGGNRVSKFRGYVNLWIVFLVSGFWHGASWNFLIWGAYQGVFLTTDRLFWAPIAERLPKLLLRLSMVFLVMMSWVVFRAEGLDQTVGMFGRLFGGGGPGALGAEISLKAWLDERSVSMLVLAALLCFLPWSDAYRKLELRALSWLRGTAPGALVAAVLSSLLLAVTLLALANSSYNPFIYFRF